MLRSAQVVARGSTRHRGICERRMQTAYADHAGHAHEFEFGNSRISLHGASAEIELLVNENEKRKCTCQPTHLSMLQNQFRLGMCICLLRLYVHEYK